MNAHTDFTAERAKARIDALAEIKAIAKASGWGHSILLELLSDEIIDSQPVVRACRSIENAQHYDDLFVCADELESAAVFLAEELRERAAELEVRE